MKVTHVAAAVIERADGQFLLGQRAADTFYPGHWEFPGGKREEGEPWADCLIRELKEELDVEVEVGEVFEEVVHRYPEKTVRLRFFFATLKKGEPRPLGCADVRWVTRAELSRHEFPPADAELIQRLVAEDAWWAA